MEETLQHPIISALQSAFDPFFLVDNHGVILWQNENAVTMFGAPDRPALNLDDAFGVNSRNQILRTDRGQSIPVRSRNVKLKDIPFACFVLDAGTGEPGRGVFLLGCKSIAPDSIKMQQHQDHLATIAHDLKNPLSAIFGYADALIGTALGESFSPKQREVVDRMRTAASRSLELVRNFQQLVQIRQRSAPNAGELSDLNVVLQNAIDSLWRGSNTQRLVTSLSKSSLKVRIDRTQLDRVISNLLTNAFKYTPPQGVITVYSDLMDGSPVFSVHNTGAVIPRAELDSIFVRYERASTSTRAPGTGLGLFIVKSILDSFGATISVVSSIESGTKFTVTFPAI